MCIRDRSIHDFLNKLDGLEDMPQSTAGNMMVAGTLVRGHLSGICLISLITSGRLILEMAARISLLVLNVSNYNFPTP